MSKNSSSSLTLSTNYISCNDCHHIILLHLALIWITLRFHVVLFVFWVSSNISEHVQKQVWSVCEQTGETQNMILNQSNSSSHRWVLTNISETKQLLVAAVCCHHEGCWWCDSLTPIFTETQFMIRMNPQFITYRKTSRIRTFSFWVTKQIITESFQNSNNIWSLKQIKISLTAELFSHLQSDEMWKESVIKEGLLISLFGSMKWKRNNNIQTHQHKDSTNIQRSEKFRFSCGETFLWIKLSISSDILHGCTNTGKSK